MADVDAQLPLSTRHAAMPRNPSICTTSLATTRALPQAAGTLKSRYSRSSGEEKRRLRPQFSQEPGMQVHDVDKRSDAGDSNIQVNVD